MVAKFPIGGKQTFYLFAYLKIKSNSWVFLSLPPQRPNIDKGINKITNFQNFLKWYKINMLYSFMLNTVYTLVIHCVAILMSFLFNAKQFSCMLL